MVIGALIVAVCLLVLGFTKEIVEFLVPDEKLAKGPTIALAVLSIYALDFAINGGTSLHSEFSTISVVYFQATNEWVVMSCSRSLIVDTLPLEKQQSGAAWGTYTCEILQNTKHA